MQKFSFDQELFPLSWLSQYGYCPRRCGLLAIEQVWEENEETASGRLQHERVHTARVERKGGDLLLYEVSVYSHTLGVNGKCDCVEAWNTPNGVYLPYGEGTFQLYPIEYKHGVVRDEEEYHMQLCAQAMCLEEQFKCEIPLGAIFYVNAHRRNEVHLTKELREHTIKTAQEIQNMLMIGKVPLANYSAKCKKCSMQAVCHPKWKRSAKRYCKSLWDMTLEKEDK